MICKKCGQENKDGAKVCESCGASLVEEHDKQKIKISKEESQKRTERQRQRSKDRDLMTYGLLFLHF